MGYPRDPTLRGLAAATYKPECLPWEHDIRAVDPDDDAPPRIGDWHRRHGRANRRDGNTARVAAALAPRIDPKNILDRER